MALEDEAVFEDDLEALKATVQRLGGNKRVGALLWPDKTPDGAARLMADCCNPGRSGRLSLSQVMLVMRMAREQGDHLLARYLMAETGYAPPVPVNPVDEAARLAHSLDGLMRSATLIVDRLDRLSKPALKAVGG
jgi:hypothetical protein